MLECDTVLQSKRAVIQLSGQASRIGADQQFWTWSVKLGNQIGTASETWNFVKKKAFGNNNYVEK